MVSLIPDLTRLRDTVGFRQEISFEEGILEMIQGLKKERKTDS